VSTYLALAPALARAKERSGAIAADDAYLTELLEMSAGHSITGVKHYRPFLVAARWLEQNRPAQTVSEADGAKFTGLAKPIASLLGLQQAYDNANELLVPAGFEAIVERKRGARSYTPRLLP
jgi:hypothetical protein